MGVSGAVAMSVTARFLSVFPPLPEIANPSREEHRATCLCLGGACGLVLPPESRTRGAAYLLLSPSTVKTCAVARYRPGRPPLGSDSSARTPGRTPGSEPA